MACNWCEALSDSFINHFWIDLCVQCTWPYKQTPPPQGKKCDKCSCSLSDVYVKQDRVRKPALRFCSQACALEYIWISDPTPDYKIVDYLNRQPNVVVEQIFSRVEHPYIKKNLEAIMPEYRKRPWFGNMAVYPIGTRHRNVTEYYPLWQFDYRLALNPDSPRPSLDHLWFNNTWVHRNSVGHYHVEFVYNKLGIKEFSRMVTCKECLLPGHCADKIWYRCKCGSTVMQEDKKIVELNTVSMVLQDHFCEDDEKAAPLLNDCGQYFCNVSTRMTDMIYIKGVKTHTYSFRYDYLKTRKKEESDTAPLKHEPVEQGLC